MFKEIKLIGARQYAIVARWSRQATLLLCYNMRETVLSAPIMVCVCVYTGYTQKNGAVSKVNKKFISRLTRAQRTPSAAATVQVSHALQTVRFSCLL